MADRVVETATPGVFTWPCRECSATPELVGTSTGDFTGYAEHWACPNCGEAWIVQVPQ